MRVVDIGGQGLAELLQRVGPLGQGRESLLRLDGVLFLVVRKQVVLFMHVPSFIRIVTLVRCQLVSRAGGIEHTGGLCRGCLLVHVVGLGRGGEGSHDLGLASGGRPLHSIVLRDHSVDELLDGLREGWFVHIVGGVVFFAGLLVVALRPHGSYELVVTSHVLVE